MNGVKMNEQVNLPAPATLNCPKCGAQLTLFTHAQARTVVCENCERLFEVRKNGLLALRHFDKDKVEPLILVGAKGRLNDVLYQVAGFVLYQERDSNARWREYVLFNPVSGYAFLSEYNGHWNFFRFLNDYSHGKAHYKSFTYEDSNFQLFHRYRANVKYAAGEFFWNLNNATPEYTEYIAPPRIITRIVSDKEITWLLGEYLEPEVIKETFGVEKAMPPRIDIGATEVFSGGLTFGKIKNATLWAAGILLALHILLAIFVPEKRLADVKLTIPEGLNMTDPKPIVGPTFKLESSLFRSSSLAVYFSAPVSNEWLSTNITFFNTTTGQEFDFETGVEFYSGYDDGYSWTEGNTQADLVLSAMPDGEYQMFIRPYKAENSTVRDFNVMVDQGVTVWSNFWIILLLIAIFPALQFFRERNFEKSRWMNSDYSPYDYA